MCKETDTFSPTGLTFYRDTESSQEKIFVEVLSALRHRSLGRLHEGGGKSIRFFQEQGSVGADVLRHGWVWMEGAW